MGLGPSFDAFPGISARTCIRSRAAMLQNSSLTWDPNITSVGLPTSTTALSFSFNIFTCLIFHQHDQFLLLTTKKPDLVLKMMLRMEILKKKNLWVFRIGHWG